MQLKLLASMTLGLSAAMALPIHAAQPSPTGAAQDAPRTSPGVMQQVESPLRAVPAKPKARNLKLAPGQHAKPVITAPVGPYTCCASRMGNKIEVNTEFDVTGTGTPGHTVRVRVDLDNGGTKSAVKNQRVTIDPQGHWKLRWVKVSSPDMNTNAGFIEINATEYFPATQVRQPDGEAHAKPAYLRFRTPAQRPMGQAASHSGG